MVGLFASVVLAGPAGASSERTTRVELYRAGDFVSQTNVVQCVGASMQMMLNMIRPGSDRSASSQLSLQRLARARSPRRIGAGGVEFVRPRRGASSFGWAAGLTAMGGGPYQVTAATSQHGALRLAAEALRETKRPVGLLVWHGAHAWVMSGFEAERTSDGRIGRIRTITVLDPWYPRFSSTYGTSPAPGTRLTPRQLAADYVPWHRHFRSPFDGEYVLVLPYTIAPAAVTTTATPTTPPDRPSLALYFGRVRPIPN
jgi:hypothetical protein